MSQLEKILTQTLTGKGDSDKHAMTLFSLVISLGAKNILELGVRHGDTTLSLLLGASYTDGKVISIDINDTWIVLRNNSAAGGINCLKIFEDRLLSTYYPQNVIIQVNSTIQFNHPTNLTGSNLSIDLNASYIQNYLTM